MEYFQMERYGDFMINQRYFMVKKDILNLIFIKLIERKTTRNKIVFLFLTIL